MTPPEVEVDAELAAKVAQVAASRGETVERVIERALAEYVRAAGEPFGRSLTRRAINPEN